MEPDQLYTNEPFATNSVNSVRPQMSPCASVVPVKVAWPPWTWVALTLAPLMGVPPTASTVKLRYQIIVMLLGGFDSAQSAGPVNAMPERLTVVFIKKLPYD